MTIIQARASVHIAIEAGTRREVQARRFLLHSAVGLRRDGGLRLAHLVLSARGHGRLGARLREHCFERSLLVLRTISKVCSYAYMCVCVCVCGSTYFSSSKRFLLVSM